jgi:hypothetical protein
MSTSSATAVPALDIVTPELAAIRQTVDCYAEGLRNGSVETLQKAFHSQAVMAGYFNADRMLLDMEGFYQLVRTVPAPAVSGEPFRYQIDSVQVSGNTATAEISEHHFLGHDFKTCFHLLKTDHQWQITAKLFNSLGPAAGEGMSK